ncbi:MAG: hypothetical protein MI862_07425 [Desulfobacterales bacterium]|nr:hypothetical protein [Desulfobacterales bacterium]
MSKSKEKIHWGEMIGGFFVLAGFIFGAIKWWLGSPFWDAISLVFVFSLTGGLIVVLAEGIRSGKLGIKGGYVYKGKTPALFWLFVLFYIMVAAVFAVISGLFLLTE